LRSQRYSNSDDTAESFRRIVDPPHPGVCVAAEQICAALHIRSYVLFRNMWSKAELEPKKSLSSAPSTAHI
jgi:hypothetical protein